MFKQHLPKFVDGTPKTSDASTLVDVLAIPWVSSWKQDRDHTFSMWTQDDRSLIAIYDEGTYWWVVGHADFDLGLPKFKDHRVIKSAKNFQFEQVIPENGMIIRTDGRGWFLLKPDESNERYLGYRADTDQWLISRYTVFLNLAEVQAVKDKLLGAKHAT